jgi:hypothetical protein
MILMLLSGAWGKVIHEKNLKQKISWHCPFKRLSDKQERQFDEQERQFDELERLFDEEGQRVCR